MGGWTVDNISATGLSVKRKRSPDLLTWANMIGRFFRNAPTQKCRNAGHIKLQGIYIGHEN